MVGLIGGAFLAASSSASTVMWDWSASESSLSTSAVGLTQPLSGGEGFRIV